MKCPGDNSEITRYAKVVETEHPELLDIELYCDAAGQQRTSGKICVPEGGAMIRFRPVNEQIAQWEFHSLTIHPMGSVAMPLDLRWTVSRSLVILNHSKPRKGASYSYTLAIDRDSYRVYLDPQMVDPGGSTPDASTG